MTTAQLKKALPGLGTNEWITLEGFCSGILIEPDCRLFVNPFHMQFYFDTDSKLLFVRNTAERPALMKRLMPGKDVSITLMKDESEHFVTLDEGGIEDRNIGRYHAVYSFDKIIITF